MYKGIEALRYSPTQIDTGHPGNGSLFQNRQVIFQREERSILATADFPPEDPWSSLAFRPAIRELLQAGWFDKQVVMEIGIGDGINELEVADNICGVIGVDIDTWRLDVCAHNLDGESQNRNIPVEYFAGDGIEFLQAWHQDKRERFSGRVLMCLPQSYGGTSTTDIINKHPLHEPYKKWHRYGMDLNAGVLSSLREIVDKDTQTLVILSDRIPDSIRKEMIDESGWSLSNNPTLVAVQQDPDTKLDWMEELEDDGRRFFDRGGKFLPIKEAISRVNAPNVARNNLDLYHNVAVYRLQPK